MKWLGDQYELMIQGAGWPDGLTISPVRRTLGEGRVVEFHMHDGKVRYAVGIGVSREINIIRRLIEKQVNGESAELRAHQMAISERLQRD